MNVIEEHSIPEPNSGCWVWLRSIDIDGYGLIRQGEKVRRSNRVAFEIYKGTIPDGEIILHSCHHPWCVNPDHLRSGTKKENTQDMIRRREANPAIMAAWKFKRSIR